MARLTALAQLVQMYAECRGITSTAEIAAATGYTDRAIRKAKAELEFRNQSSSGTGVPEPEFQTRNQSSAPRARTSYTKEPKGSIFTDTEKQRQSDAMRAALTTEVQKVIWTDDHKLKIICPIEHAEQLKKFGNDEARLNLALEQAAGYIQPNNVRPLLVQVRAQLAQQAAWKTDSDKRYQQKAASSSKTLQDEFRGIL